MSCHDNCVLNYYYLFINFFLFKQCIIIIIMFVFIYFILFFCCVLLWLLVVLFLARCLSLSLFTSLYLSFSHLSLSPLCPILMLVLYMPTGPYYNKYRSPIKRSKLHPHYALIKTHTPLKKQNRQDIVKKKERNILKRLGIEWKLSPCYASTYISCNDILVR